MALVKWKDIYSVNVEEIDNQHKKLFDIINRLYGSLSTGDSRAELQLILDDLIDYADVHFKTEKKYFDKYNYSGSLSHESEHLKFEKIVLQFKESFAIQALKFHYPIETFLFDWLMNHIMTEDTKYNDCFKSNGLK
jgi:hemerythrin